MQRPPVAEVHLEAANLVTVNGNDALVAETPQNFKLVLQPALLLFHALPQSVRLCLLERAKTPLLTAEQLVDVRKAPLPVFGNRHVASRRFKVPRREVSPQNCQPVSEPVVDFYQLHSARKRFFFVEAATNRLETNLILIRCNLERLCPPATEQPLPPAALARQEVASPQQPPANVATYWVLFEGVEQQDFVRRGEVRLQDC